MQRREHPLAVAAVDPAVGQGQPVAQGASPQVGLVQPLARAEHRATAQPEDIIAWAREHMAAYKVPRIVAFADALPKSGSGKVMWRLLQEQEAPA